MVISYIHYICSSFRWKTRFLGQFCKIPRKSVSMPKLGFLHWKTPVTWYLSFLQKRSWSTWAHEEPPVIALLVVSNFSWLFLILARSGPGSHNPMWFFDTFSFLVLFDVQLVSQRLSRAGEQQGVFLFLGAEFYELILSVTINRTAKHLQSCNIYLVTKLVAWD